MVRKPSLRQRIVAAMQEGKSPKAVGREVHRRPDFVKRVYREWQDKNLGAARLRGGD